MLSSRIDRLFHSLVVLGAAMGAGCDPHVEVPGATGGSGGGQGGSGASTSMGGSTGTTSGSVGPGSTGSTGSGTTTDSYAKDPSDCEYTSQFACNAEGTCHCDPSLPKGPEDCLSTADFSCLEYMPEYVTCYCYEPAPDKPEDCDDPTFFHCAIDNPPIGCYCLVPIA
ncbi:MAG: hypothetical protein R3B70_37355 [Polyangiaceae bacterium]